MPLGNTSANADDAVESVYEVVVYGTSATNWKVSKVRTRIAAVDPLLRISTEEVVP